MGFDLPRSGFEKDWQRRFEHFAEATDDDAGIGGWSSTGLGCRFRFFSQVWKGGVAGSRWLDAGCGAGTYTRFLAGRGLRMVGTDYSLPTLLKAAQRDTRGAGWLVADVNHLPLNSASFSGALCFGVMQALADPRPALREMADVIQPGGELWVDALNASCLPHFTARLRRRLQGAPMHLRYDYPGHLRRQMKETGLTEIRSYWVPILPQRWQRWQPWLESAAVRWMFRRLPLLGPLFSHAFLVRGRRPVVKV
jgi:ubiquinone/menaquinone biosynthesis C-methylase UbiE